MKCHGISSLMAVSQPPTRRCLPRLARSTAAACSISVYSQARCSLRSSTSSTPLRGCLTRTRAQEREALMAQLAEPPDAVPRWRRSNALIGAGPTGYVYQVRAAVPAATRSADKGLRRL